MKSLATFGIPSQEQGDSSSVFPQDSTCVPSSILQAARSQRRAGRGSAWSATLQTVAAGRGTCLIVQHVCFLPLWGQR